MTIKEWKFLDQPNVAVITDRRIINGQAYISMVSHDADDGAWQFLANLPFTEADAILVSLQSVVQVDSSVEQLAELPLGWRAWRDSKDSQWNISRVD